MSPGHPIALITCAGCPFTDTSSGEFTACDASSGNGWPGFTPGRVGPRPDAFTIKTSPARAGLAAVTGVKSLWKIAGELPTGRISGRAIGITWSTKKFLPPPNLRRLAGSSVVDADLMGTGAAFTA